HAPPRVARPRSSGSLARLDRYVRPERVARHEPWREAVIVHRGTESEHEAHRTRRTRERRTNWGALLGVANPDHGGELVRRTAEHDEQRDHARASSHGTTGTATHRH